MLEMRCDATTCCITKRLWQSWTSNSALRKEELSEVGVTLFATIRSSVGCKCRLDTEGRFGQGCIADGQGENRSVGDLEMNEWANGSKVDYRDERRCESVDDEAQDQREKLQSLRARCNAIRVSRKRMLDKRGNKERGEIQTDEERG